MRGGEKVLEALCEVYPGADIFTLLWIKGSVSETIEKHNIKTSFLQAFPGVEKKYRYYLPLMPTAIESFKLSGYDLVISSSHCVAKGVKKGNNALHFCYCHAPMRYIWDQYEEYFNSKRAGILARVAMKIARPYLQKWDVASSNGVDYFISNSKHIKEKIARIYGRDADVIYPPVDTSGYPPASDGGYFLMVSALVPYKRVDIAIEAFNILGYQLKIIGKGPDMERLKTMAKPNIEFLGWQSGDEIKKHYSACRAFIFPQEEDFGITAVEAQAAGKPVIAFGKGGALETIIEGKTGVFFKSPEPGALAEAVKRFARSGFRNEDAVANASKFSLERFKTEIARYIDTRSTR